jgi:hypothetical protein
MLSNVQKTPVPFGPKVERHLIFSPYIFLSFDFANSFPKNEKRERTTKFYGSLFSCLHVILKVGVPELP